MTELIGETCDHYRSHLRYHKEREDDTVIEYFICHECNQEWEWKRGPTIAEEAEQLHKELETLKETIISEL